MRILFKIVILLIVLGSCSDEPVETVFRGLDTENGVFIACEGNFMYGNGSLSFYNSDKKNIINQIFYAKNNAPLGDVVQSLEISDNTIYIVVNNSGKVYIADVETLEFKNVITGLTSPRYIHFVSPDKMYISDLYSNYITVVNPSTLAVTGRINTGEHTSEQMVQTGRYVFVSAWSYDEYLLVIDTETDKMITKIKVPSQPKDLVVDRNDKIWVLSDGGNAWGTEGNQQPALSRIDPLTFTIEQIYRFDEGSVPAGLETGSTGDTLYYINMGIFKMPVDSRFLPEIPFIEAENKTFYSLAVNPENNEIYVADALDYLQNAIVFRYAQSGVLMDTFHSGINPSDYLFR
jgi:YVTN family beta-propeller protein